MVVWVVAVTQAMVVVVVAVGVTEATVVFEGVVALDPCRVTIASPHCPAYEQSATI